MKIGKRGVLSLVVAGALAGVGAGIGVADANSNNQPPIHGQSGHQGPYPVNKAGLSYGPVTLGESQGIEPDLILAVGQNNVTGYVRSTDLNPAPKNPAEAAALARNTAPRAVPLYSSEGKVVGHFVVTPSAPQTTK